MYNLSNYNSHDNYYSTVYREIYIFDSTISINDNNHNIIIYIIVVKC